MNLLVMYKYGLMLALPFWIDHDTRIWQKTTKSWPLALGRTLIDPSFWICVFFWPVFLLGVIDDLTRKM